ncbi:sensor histidine kinase [Hydrogenimonas cancrithermarum]|uniref:histidine kinase n=1 Tax=Hydrogenimonas cancrithermarum TaxID=2993563 RepID=A0ABN6WTW2_9BACT|nr:ATP-binding protein [Hydrogenimonas cancrithermarum]BDY12301.1 hypothetical protein HCR_06130 [Hydrogenimonas cancrithermarum]
MRAQSASGRLLKGYAVLLGVVLLFLGILFYTGLNLSFENSLHSSLESIALDLKNDELAHPQQKSSVIDPKEEFPLSPVSIEVYRFTAGKPERILFTKNMQDHRFGHSDPGFYIEEIPFVSKEDESGLLVYRAQKNGIDYLIKVAVPINKIDDTLETFTALLVFFGFVIFLVALYLGYRAIERVLSPMRNITETAATISQSNLSKRIELPKEKDEFFELAYTFNTMLDRLENAFNQARRFNASVSHELKTPLTIIRGEIDVALIRERSSKEYAEVLHSVLEETDKLQSIIETMLLLSKSDTRALKKRFRLVSLDKLVGEAIDQMRPSAVAKNIEFELRCDKVTVDAEPTLLRRAIVNLLDNAVKFSPDGSVIKVVLQKTRKGVELKIVDQGPGIPENLKEKIFEPFYRIEKKWETTTSGSGLGLSIARWIAQLHNGNIYVTSGEEGSEFVIRFSQ